MKLLLPLRLLLVLSLWSIVSAQQQQQQAAAASFSQEQSDQLTQLEQAIVQSADPQATLLEVAQANNMDPQQLVTMLEQNHAQGGGGGAMQQQQPRQVQAWPQQVMKLMTAMGVIVSQIASKNPRAFSLVILTLVCLGYMGIMAPRNGLVISTSNGMMSKGHTAWWSPPTTYVDRFLESRQLAKKVPSIQKLDWTGQTVEITNDGMQWHKKLGGRKAKLASAATAQATIYLDDIIPEELREDDDDDDGIEKEEDDMEALREEVSDILYQQAATNVLTGRRFTEFTDDAQLRVQTKSKSGLLVLPHAGDWGRYGLQSLQVAHQSEDDTSVRIHYSTLKGGIFDGQIQWSVAQTPAGNVIVQVQLWIPKKGRPLKKALAMTLVSSLLSSMVRSIETDANQRLARQHQGKRFSLKAKDRAIERRQVRFEKEQQMEDMAEDRRRKWQRGNPDAGRYRPSGDRMRSPKNC